MARGGLRDPWSSREEGSLLLRLVLGLATRLRGPLAALGVEPAAFRELLRTRVLLDLRPSSDGPRAIGVAGIVLTVLAAWGMGLLTGIAALYFDTADVWVNVSLTALAFLLLVYLLQVLVAQLLDPGDVEVLARYPVGDRTIFAVRLAQVGAYLSFVSVSFLSGNLLLAVLRQPLLPTLLVYPLLTLACTLTVLGAVALFFAVLLRLAGPERFQRVSLWAQVGVATLLVGGVQVVPRVLPESVLDGLVDSWESWRVLYPPDHYARVFALASGEASAANVLGLVGTVLLPFAALAFTLRLSKRSFLAGLEGTLELGGRRERRWGTGLFGRLGRSVCRSSVQRAGYDVAVSLSRREPHVLRAVLPQLVSFQAMALVIGVLDRDTPGVPATFVPVSSALASMALPLLLDLSQSSSTPKARWVLASRPLGRAELDAFLQGAAKGLAVAWLGTTLVVVAVLQLCIVGPAGLPEVVLGVEMAGVSALAFARRWRMGVPFSREVPKAGQMQNVGLALAMMGAAAGIVGLHLLLALHPASLALGIVLFGWLLARGWRGLDTLRVTLGAPRRARRTRGGRAT